MFANDIQQCALNKDCCNLDFCVNTITAYVKLYMEQCPVAPYTGYMVLGFFVVFFYLMWSWAAAAAAKAKAVNAVLLKRETATNVDPKDLMETFSDLQTKSIESIRYMQQDALHRLASSQESALAHIQTIVASYNEDSE